MMEARSSEAGARTPIRQQVLHGIFFISVDPAEDEAVEVDVESQGRIEAVTESDCSGSGVADAHGSAALPEPAEDASHVDPAHGRAGLGIVHAEIA